MPRTCPAALKTHLQAGNATLAFLYLLVRRDASRFAFTSHPWPITYNGDIYYPGATVSDVRSVAGLEADTSEIGRPLTGSTLISSDNLKAEELEGGRFDGALVTKMVVNWKDLTMGSMVLESGRIGDISLRDFDFTASVRGLSSSDDTELEEHTSLLCRNVFCGGRCGVNPAGSTVGGNLIQKAATVSANGTRLVFTAALLSGFPATHFDRGKLTWTSGQNNAMTYDIKTVSTGGVVTLQRSLIYAALSGETLTAQMGCDKRIETCNDTFNSVLRFGGEPHIPGEHDRELEEPGKKGGKKKKVKGEAPKLKHGLQKR